MTPPSLPPEVFDALSPAVQAYIRHLEARLADLEARLNQNSTNSSKPPSSDPPHAKPAPPRTPSGKQKGGQPPTAVPLLPQLRCGFLEIPAVVQQGEGVELRVGAVGLKRRRAGAEDVQKVGAVVVRRPAVGG